jgi:NAD(P)-dependent dehydrogenase (short-subunit alcohol dehydrogenase family)
MAGYTASKFGVRGLTKAAALDLGRYNIRVNSVQTGALAYYIEHELQLTTEQGTDWLAGRPVEGIQGGQDRSGSPWVARHSRGRSARSWPSWPRSSRVT